MGQMDCPENRVSALSFDKYMFDSEYDAFGSGGREVAVEPAAFLIAFPTEAESLDRVEP